MLGTGSMGIVWVLYGYRMVMECTVRSVCMVRGVEVTLQSDDSGAQTLESPNPSIGDGGFPLHVSHSSAAAVMVRYREIS